MNAWLVLFFNLNLMFQNSQAGLLGVINPICQTKLERIID